MNAINCTAPENTSGPWSIEEFTISKKEADAYNLRCFINRKMNLLVSPGTYKRLLHEDRGVVMSNTLMEVKTNLPFLTVAHGRVLINGLGMGMLLDVLLPRRTIKHVTVVEVDQDVINLTYRHFQPYMEAAKLEIVHADAYEYKPPWGPRFDAVWHDIWDSMTDENLPDMGILRRKYAKRAAWQGCWAEQECKDVRNMLMRRCLNAGYSSEMSKKILAKFSMKQSKQPC